MKLKIATVLATAVVAAAAGFVLGFAYAGPGGWLGPMPIVAGLFIATYLAILALVVGSVISTLPQATWWKCVGTGAASSLVANLGLAVLLGGPPDFALQALAESSGLGMAIAVVYKMTGNWLSRFE
ncbi:MAG: hypothetical protein SFY67_09390 [Candidatus Melainabacteria bacterium]|nr:hypothetical protein [Candidatus Melainabacteria bacterium]